MGRKKYSFILIALGLIAALLCACGGQNAANATTTAAATTAQATTEAATTASEAATTAEATTAAATTEAPTTAATTAAATTEATTAATTEAPTTEAAKAAVALRFSWWGGDERHEATLEVISQFESLYDYITIEGEYGSADGYKDKLATQLASGTAPDIMQIDPAVLPSFIVTDASYFADYYEYGFNFSKFDEAYYKQRINGCYDGKQYGIPTGVAGTALLINKDLADAIGVDLTSQQYTWDDLIDLGKKVREYDSDMYLININKDYLTNLFANIYAKQLTGMQFIDVEAKQLNYSADVFAQTFAFMKSLIDNEVIPPLSYSSAYDGDNLQNDPNWIAGKYVGSVCYTSTIGVLADANKDANYAAGYLPVMPGAQMESWNANCPQVISVSAKSKNINEAMMFVDYFFNDPTAMGTLLATRSVPPTAEARAICTQKGAVSELLASSVNIVVGYNSIFDDDYLSSQEAKEIMIGQVEQVGYGVMTPEDAAAETVSLLERLIASKG